MELHNERVVSTFAPPDCPSPNGSIAWVSQGVSFGNRCRLSWLTRATFAQSRREEISKCGAVPEKIDMWQSDRPRGQADGTDVPSQGISSSDVVEDTQPPDRPQQLTSLICYQAPLGHQTSNMSPCSWFINVSAFAPVSHGSTPP